MNSLFFVDQGISAKERFPHVASFPIHRFSLLLLSEYSNVASLLDEFFSELSFQFPGIYTVDKQHLSLLAG